MKGKKENYGPNCIGNVIRIISNKALIIDVGKDVLNIGDTVAIYVYGEPILDLSGNELCHYEFTKARLDVVDVNEKYSICKMPSISKTVRALSPLLETTLTTQPTFNVEQDNIEPLTPYTNFIQKGDPVKLV